MKKPVITKHHLAILKEINSKIDLVLELQQSMIKKLDRFKKETGNNFKIILNCLSKISAK